MFFPAYPSYEPFKFSYLPMTQVGPIAAGFIAQEAGWRWVMGWVAIVSIPCPKTASSKDVSFVIFPFLIATPF